MMNSLPLILFGISVIMGLYSRSRVLPALGAMACCAGAVLAGLVAGWSLEQLSAGVLALCAVALWPLTGKGDAD